MYNDIQSEVSNLITQIKEFWGNSVSNIQVTSSTNKPFSMFTLQMKFFKNFDVIMEYERSTLGISIKKGNDYIILSKLANEPIFRGLQSYIPQNLLHNFEVLDRVLKSM